MPRLCGDCAQRIEPVALPFVTANDESGWFLVCPHCRYVFGKLDPAWFSVDPTDVLDSQSESESSDR